MLAYLDASNTPQPWTGQAITDGSGNPVYYPLNVEQQWTADQLVAAGLYPVTPFVPPAGQMITPGATATYTLNGTARTSGSTVTQTFATEATPALVLPPQATDDSHAAGLSPPVPIGGIYCNGSQMMMRQS
jgi:hypothetical protein